RPAEPPARIEPPQPAPRRPPASRRTAAPQLHIGTIEVTVVPPPAVAPPQPVPQQPRAAAAHRPRPVRGPDRPVPWFGLAQR
ncbi:MAG TPA: hypothetical protein VHC67_07135, partial [Gaiellaceae bacterium]|nr:hypothetical protein [Gaiellaceae bacterium]